ncbi:tyrosine-type recombinase/integrase [Streptomyces sp. NPDC057250]|uniref:tyrosine-type recombinase/integrase n=1 Tax=Streptomyces sp. NPDC057250 TaxID=3346068 RepID=UPI00362BD493
MASVVPRKNAAGEVTSYQVKWRLGGKGGWQTERFDDDDSAKVFKEAVEAAGHQWPPGWKKGVGYLSEEAQYRFEDYARRSILRRTSDNYYRHQCIRALEMYIFPTFGHADIRSTSDFSKETVTDWISLMRRTKVKRGGSGPKGTIKLMSPETLRGLHALLSSVLKEATLTEPPLRDRNPCVLTKLPKHDDRGVGDAAGDELEFLTPEEVAGLVSCFPRPSDQLLLRVAYGTGMRWGEITALCAHHIRSPAPGEYEVRVVQAWKRLKPSVYELGPPKTPAGRRTVDIPESLWEELQAAGVHRRGKDALVFQGLDGGRLKYRPFRERWLRAVGKAKAAGLLPDWKNPTFHDLRHSHVAALLSDGANSLTYVQRRLGHESIVTTSDRYGHLLDSAYKVAVATIDRALGVGVASPATAAAGPVALPAQAAAGQVVHVLHAGERMLAFWDAQDAAAVAEQWELDRGEPAEVERASVSWWERAGEGGLDAVRKGMPGRVRVWSVGPAVYGAEGTERAGRPEDHQPRAGWAWDWEWPYTTELAVRDVDGRAGGEVKASAWGLSRTAVAAAYEEARADAVRLCAAGVQG